MMHSPPATSLPANTTTSIRFRGWTFGFIALASFVSSDLLMTLPAVAQQSPAESLAADALEEPTDAERDALAQETPATIPLLELILKGGWLMVPIGVMSLIVVAIGFERALGLRRARILPRGLTNRLAGLAERDAFDPRSAYRICQSYPSSASRVIGSMLLKVGRPHSEVEHAVSEACQGEADRLYANVRTLNLAAAITPLMGLLGTVWGMIQSFFVTANLPVGSNKGEALAEGIYVALVTTFAGLAVAIPAAMLAHFFEGRILKLMREVEQLLGSLLPYIEQYEGRLRIDKESLALSDEEVSANSHRETKAS